MTSIHHTPKNDHAKELWDACRQDCSLDEFRIMWSSIDHGLLDKDDMNQVVTKLFHLDNPRTDLVVELLNVLWPSDEHLVDHGPIFEMAISKEYVDVFQFFMHPDHIVHFELDHHANAVANRLAGHISRKAFEMFSLVEPFAEPDGVKMAMKRVIVRSAMSYNYFEQAIQQSHQIIDLLIERRGMAMFDDIAIIFRHDEKVDIDHLYFGIQRTAWREQQAIRNAVEDDPGRAMARSKI